MSSLWTPGGEVPVDRDAPPPGPPDGPPSEGPPHEETPDEAALAAEYERMQRQILEAPAADVIAQHAMSLYELAAVHLSQERPRLDDARLVIDALDALVEALRGRLGAAEAPLTEALPQLKMAFVQATDRVRSGSAD
jgi:hypothetical protein